MRLLLLTPRTFNYETRIQSAFERIGHDVEWLDERLGNSVWIKAATRLGLLRLIPGLMQRHVDMIKDRARIFDAERIIVINPETLRGQEFVQLKAALPDLEIIVYRWDSLAQKPIDEGTFDAATAVYSFDPVDCEGDARLRHLPLFHNHTLPPVSTEVKDQPVSYDLSFVGTAQLRRVKGLGQLSKMLDVAKRPYFFYLKSQSPIHHLLFWVAARIYGYRGSLTPKPLAYDQFLQVVSESAAVVDIEFGRQSGLTMRTFEVVFSGMPLLTTNENVERYDFAQQSAVFVFNETSKTLPDFSGASNTGIITYFDKYSIETWARTLANLDVNYYYANPISKFE